MSAGRDMWSRRRDAVKAETEALERAQEADIVARERATLEEKSDAEILEELDLRDPGEMGAGDDFSGFMKAVVPERLRRRALRKLWLTNPLLASVDDLVEYGEDYTDASTVIEGMKTAYQVGSGMLKHVRQVEKEAEEEAAKAETPAQDDDSPPEQKVVLITPEPMVQADDGGSDHGESLETDIQESELVEGVAPELPAVLPTQDDANGGVGKRKMRFEFAD